MSSWTRTPEEALSWFRQTGTPVAHWAVEHGFEPAVVYALLNRRTRGHRGKAHQAALALGLKPPIDDKTCTPAAQTNRPSRRG